MPLHCSQQSPCDRRRWAAKTARRGSISRTPHSVTNPKALVQAAAPKARSISHVEVALGYVVRDTGSFQEHCLEEFKPKFNPAWNFSPPVQQKKSCQRAGAHGRLRVAVTRQIKVATRGRSGLELSQNSWLSVFASIGLQVRITGFTRP